MSEPREKLRIISDGHADNTKIYFGDKQLRGISKIEIDDIEPDGSLTATLTFCDVAIDMHLEKIGVKVLSQITEHNLLRALTKDD